jgi:predicted nucleic acid-binding Zn ribbon protein
LLGETGAATKLLPKIKPVQLYGTPGLHCTAVSWQIQDDGKVCVQKIFNILTQKWWKLEVNYILNKMLYLLWILLHKANYYLTQLCLNYSNKNKNNSTLEIVVV